MTKEESLAAAAKRVSKWPKWKQDIGLQQSPNKKENNMRKSDYLDPRDGSKSKYLSPDHDLVLRNYVEGYWKDCPDCHGTGRVSQAIGDPPEQCFCDQVDPPEYLDESEITDELCQELGRVPCEVRDEDYDKWLSVKLLAVVQDGDFVCLHDDPGGKRIWLDWIQIRIRRSTVDEMRKAKEAGR